MSRKKVTFSDDVLPLIEAPKEERRGRVVALCGANNLAQSSYAKVLKRGDEVWIETSYGSIRASADLTRCMQKDQKDGLGLPTTKTLGREFQKKKLRK